MSAESILKDLSAALAAEGCDPERIGDFEAYCIGQFGRLRKQRDRDIRDMQIAQLIPEGPVAVMERFGCPKRTAFWRAARGRNLLKRVQRNT